MSAAPPMPSAPPDPRSGRLIQHLAGVHDARRIQRRLDPPHHRQLCRRAAGGKLGACSGRCHARPKRMPRASLRPRHRTPGRSWRGRAPVRASRPGRHAGCNRPDGQRHRTGLGQASARAASQRAGKPAISGLDADVIGTGWRHAGGRQGRCPRAGTRSPPVRFTTWQRRLRRPGWASRPPRRCPAPPRRRRDRGRRPR